MLHELRVTLKKIRYALEAMGRPATPIKYLQDILGEVHDLETLLKLTGKNKKIKKEQQALSDEALLLMKPALRFALEHLGDE